MGGNAGGTDKIDKLRKYSSAFRSVAADPMTEESAKELLHHKNPKFQKLAGFGIVV